MKIDFYSEETPEFLNEFAQTKAMERLKNVGMHCGCEYTNFERFKNLKPYSRFDHSLGAAKIVWNFTHDKAQTLATLFHDIATPVFAHTIDFLNGDSLTQESTELLTEDFIKNDSKIMELLEKHNLKIEDVKPPFLLLTTSLRNLALKPISIGSPSYWQGSFSTASLANSISSAEIVNTWSVMLIRI